MSCLVLSCLVLQVVITPHPLNVETEMTLGEFKELLTRVGLIKTKQLKKEYAPMPDLISGTSSTAGRSFRGRLSHLLEEMHIVLH